MQDLFSVQYNQLRPKGIAVRRKRETELQHCKQVKSDQEQKRDTVEDSWKWSNLGLSQMTEETVDHGDELDLDVAPMDACQPATMMNEQEIYLNDFDRYIHIDRIPKDCMAVRDSETLLSTVPMELNKTPCFSSLPPSSIDLGSPLQPELNERYVSHTQGRNPSTQMSPVLIDSPWPSVHIGAWPLDMERGDLNPANLALSTRLEQINEPDVDKHASTPHSSCLIPATEDSSQNATSSNISGQRIRMSELSALVERLSRCSLGEKASSKRPSRVSQQPQCHP